MVEPAGQADRDADSGLTPFSRLATRPGDERVLATDHASSVTTTGLWSLNPSQPGPAIT
jgi:hypothetical protein